MVMVGLPGFAASPLSFPEKGTRGPCEVNACGAAAGKTIRGSTARRCPAAPTPNVRRWPGAAVHRVARVSQVRALRAVTAAADPPAAVRRSRRNSGTAVEAVAPVRPVGPCRAFSVSYRLLAAGLRLALRRVRLT